MASPFGKEVVFAFCRCNSKIMSWYVLSCCVCAIVCVCVCVCLCARTSSGARTSKGARSLFAACRGFEPHPILSLQVVTDSPILAHARTYSAYNAGSAQ